MGTVSLDRGAPTFVAGHRGLVGGAVMRHFEDAGFTRLVTRTSAELDLRDTARSRRSSAPSVRPQS